MEVEKLIYFMDSRLHRRCLGHYMVKHNLFLRQGFCVTAMYATTNDCVNCWRLAMIFLLFSFWYFPQMWKDLIDFNSPYMYTMVGFSTGELLLFDFVSFIQDCINNFNFEQVWMNFCVLCNLNWFTEMFLRTAPRLLPVWSGGHVSQWRFVEVMGCGSASHCSKLYDELFNCNCSGLLLN